MQHSTRQRRSETGVMFPSSVSSSSTSPSTSKNRLTAILNSFRNQMPKVADFQRLSEDEKMIAYRRSMLMLDYIDQKSRQARVAAVVRSVTTRTSNAPLMERIRTNSGSNTVQQESGNPSAAADTVPDAAAHPPPPSPPVFPTPAAAFIGYCVNFPAENHEGVMVQAKITSVEPDGTLRIRSHQAGQNNKKLTVRRVVAGLLRRLDFLEQENHTLIQRVKTDQRTIACLEERGGELKEKEEAKFSVLPHSSSSSSSSAAYASRHRQPLRNDDNIIISDSISSTSSRRRVMCQNQHLVLHSGAKRMRLSRVPRDWPSNEGRFITHFIHPGETMENSLRLRLCINYSSADVVKIKTISDREDPNYVQPGHNRGLFANTFIEKGAFILPYSGKVVLADDDGCCDYEIPFPAYDPTRSYVVRPLEYGNEARFINDYRHHGCRQRHANVQLKQAWSRHTGACFIGVFAKLDIGIGEELLMDYGKHYWQLQRRKRHLGLPKAVIPIPSKDKAERYLANEEEGGDTKSRMVTQKGERKSSNDEHITLLSSTPSSSLSPHRPRPPPPRGGILEGFGVEVFGSGDQTPLYTPKQQEKIQRLKDFTGIKDDDHAAILLKDKSSCLVSSHAYFPFFLLLMSAIA
mmetsp:Transcript_16557/g.26431  ORF Transcript_16557/g.26431 Transcript_16557/m.26431 type:complete len:633 (-) Transcript_16557:8-1906(-)